MSHEVEVLRALLRLARRRTPPTLEQLLVRVSGDAIDARRSLRSLARSGLIHETKSGISLSLGGFAVAVACANLSRTQAKAPAVAVARVARRRRAA